MKQKIEIPGNLPPSQLGLDIRTKQELMESIRIKRQTGEQFDEAEYALIKSQTETDEDLPWKKH